MTSQPDTAKKAWADYQEDFAAVLGGGRPNPWLDARVVCRNPWLDARAAAVCRFLEKTFPDGPPPPARRPFQVGDVVRDDEGRAWEIVAPERMFDGAHAAEVAVWRKESGYGSGCASDFTLITPAGEAE